MAHKQDRHNCSIMLNLKLFLSDVNHWKVFITGHHVPPDGSCPWHPPSPEKQRLDEDIRDLIVTYADRVNPSEIVDIISKKRKLPEMSAKKKVSYFVSSMKKRRRERDYNYAETVQQMHEKEESGNIGSSMMQHIPIGGPDADLINAAKDSETLTMQAPSGSTAGQHVSAMNKMVLSDNREVILVTDDPGSDLLALCEMMDSGANIVEIQTSESASQGNEIPISNSVVQHHGVAVSQNLGNRVMIRTVNPQGFSKGSLIPQAGKLPILHPPQPALATTDSGTLNGNPSNSGKYVDVTAGLSMNDVATLNDLGALLLAANHQKSTDQSESQ